MLRSQLQSYILRPGIVSLVVWRRRWLNLRHSVSATGETAAASLRTWFHLAIQRSARYVEQSRRSSYPRVIFIPMDMKARKPQSSSTRPVWLGYHVGTSGSLRIPCVCRFICCTGISSSRPSLIDSAPSAGIAFIST